MLEKASLWRCCRGVLQVGQQLGSKALYKKRSFHPTCNTPSPLSRSLVPLPIHFHSLFGHDRCFATLNTSTINQFRFLFGETPSMRITELFLSSTKPLLKSIPPNTHRRRRRRESRSTSLTERICYVVKGNLLSAHSEHTHLP